MLKQLTIKNYALIRHLEMEPDGGLNVITGETGAGKSIMLGAVGLLLGNRADTKVLWDENEKCVTEAEFDISAYKLQKLFKQADLDYDERTVIRREINPNGKSRAFINDTPVTLEVLKSISSRLMDVHSQHETLELGSRTFQLQLIDSFAGNQKIKDEYEVAWSTFVVATRNFETLQAEAKQLEQESDFVKFQLDELVKASLRDGEQSELETELKIQEHAEEIKSRLNAAADALTESDYSVSRILGDIKSQLQNLTAYSPDYEALFQRIESVRIEIGDIANEVERAESRVEFDKVRLEEVSSRLNTIYQLLQKHRARDISTLLQLQESFQEKADKATNLDSLLAELQRKASIAKKELDDKAEALSKSRMKVFANLSKQVTGLLKELGIPDAQVKIERSESAPGPTGKDNVEIFFSANKGIEPRPLAQVASGGEFSRVMFAVKYIMAEKTAMPTLVLDEIDTGVSGEIAISLGKLMQSMAERHQVVAISHLPQIAAKGDAHYYVFKDNSSKKTVSSVKKLTESERVEEIAKMIGGAKPSKSALENARELISR